MSRSTVMLCPARSNSSGLFKSHQAELRGGSNFPAHQRVQRKPFVNITKSDCRPTGIRAVTFPDMTVGSSFIVAITAASTITIAIVPCRVLIRLRSNGRSTDLKSSLRPFIRCCSVPPSLVNKIYTNLHLPCPVHLKKIPWAVSTGSSSAVSTQMLTCSNWSTQSKDVDQLLHVSIWVLTAEGVRFLLPTSTEGDLETCPNFCFVPIFCANSHGIDLRRACPRSFA